MGEIKDEVNNGDGSIGEEEGEGPNMSLSLNSEGVKGIGRGTSSLPGKGKRGGSDGVER